MESLQAQAQNQTWTVDSLYSYIVTLFEEQRRYYDAHFISSARIIDVELNALKELINATLIASEKAITKAETAAEKRFESVNEFREVLSSQQATLITKSEADIRFQALGAAKEAQHLQIQQKLDAISSRIDKMEGKTSGYMGAWGVLLGAVALISAFLSIFMRMKGL